MMLQRSAAIFLLKQKLAIGVNIKVVVQILSFLMNGQPGLKSIPIKIYDPNTKTSAFFHV
jgi:hypothetical protein